MSELQLGPNGGLLAAMEFLEENLDEWLGEELQVGGDECCILHFAFQCLVFLYLYG